MTYSPHSGDGARAAAWQGGQATSMTGRELAAREFELLPIPDGPDGWAGAIGQVEPSAYGLIWGKPGAGKSTFAIVWAYVLAHFGAVYYYAVEEGLGYTLSNKVKRLEAYHPDLHFKEFFSLEHVESEIDHYRSQYGPKGQRPLFVFLDSYNEMNARKGQMDQFRAFCKRNRVGLWIIVHSLKAGNNYRGPSELGHGTDVIAQVTEEGVLQTTKNRYAQRDEARVPFSVDELPGGPVLRKNPVDLPFTITLGEIIESNGNAARSTKTLNRLVGHRYGCMVRENPEKEPVQLQFEDARFEKTKSRPEAKKIVTMIVGGEVYDEVCAATLKEAIAEIKERHGDLVVEITSQEQARKVLGAKEYRRQEKARQERIEEETEEAPAASDEPEAEPEPELPTGDLPFDPDRVFTDPEGAAGAVELPIAQLELDHFDAEKAARAERHLREAWAGRRAKREPIEVIDLHDGTYQVEDGNHTFSVLEGMGWPAVRAVIVDEEAKAPTPSPEEQFDAGMDRIEKLLQNALA